jgi:hypothetical protein
MAHICGFCEHEIGEGPKIELLCHHFFHTNCFLINMNMGDQCAVCEEPFLGGGQGEEDEDVAEDAQSVQNTPQTDQTFILNLYNTNRHFRRDIKTYAHAVSSINRHKREVQKLLVEKKAEVAEPYALLKAQYEGLYNTKKEEVVNSDAYKNYKKFDTRAQRLYAGLRTKYGVYSYQFPAFRNTPGLKRLRGPRHAYGRGSRPSSLIRRALRLRLSWL